MPEKYKPMDINKFKKHVKKLGCYIVFDTDHLNYIYNSEDQLVSTFAIKHETGSKKYVKPFYIRQFENNLGV